MKTILILTMTIAALLMAACGVATPQATPTAPAATATLPAAEDADVPAAEVSLTMQPWQWHGYSGPEEQFTVETPESYQVTFNADGTINIVADCNNAAGTYTDEDGALTIIIGPMTMAACPDGSRSDQFVTLLGAAARYFFADGNLYIDLMADGGTMRLDPAGEMADNTEEDAAAAVDAAALQAMVAGVMANPWKWTTFSSADEEFTVEDPASYMVTFNEDGTVEIQADCNNASGAYTLDGANVIIEIGPATLAACPEDSRSEQFLQLLGNATQLLPIGDQLYITQKTEDSTMILDAVSHHGRRSVRRAGVVDQHDRGHAGP